MKIIKKTVLLLLVISLTLMPLVSCTSGGKPIMTFRGTTLSTNMFSYMLSARKASLKNNFDYYNNYYYQYTGQYYFGTPDFDAYFASEQKNEDGTTFTLADEAMKTIVTAAKQLVIIKELCKQYDLKQTDESVISEIEACIEDEINQAGNKEFLNIVLSEVGADVDIERDYLTNMTMYNVLYDYLYGENGTQRVADSLVNEEFKKTYKKIDSVYYPFYDTDDEGNERIIEDVVISDEAKKDYYNNNYTNIKIISFYYLDTSTTTGKELPDEQKAAKKQKAEELFNGIKNGTKNFEEVQSEFNEDQGMDKDNDGLCITKGQLDEKLQKLEEEAFKMEIGSCSFVETDIGIVILKRIPLEDKDYTESVQKTINDALVKKTISDTAEDMFEKIQSRELAMTDASVKNHDLYGKYANAFVFTSGDLTDAFNNEIEKLTEIGSSLIYSTDSGVYIIRRLDLEDEDVQSVYDKVYEELASAEYNKYLESFYSEIIIDEAELGKYSFTSAKIPVLAPLETENYTSK